MAQERGFWIGLGTGLLAGAAGAALWRGPGAGGPRAGAGFAKVRQRAFRSRRDAPESGGDPARLSPAGTDVSTGFLRPGGAPGGLHDPEALEIPGRPGQSVPDSHISTPVHPASRTVELYKGPPREAGAGQPREDDQLPE